MATTDTTQDEGQYAGLAQEYGLSTTGNPALDAVQDAAVAHAVSVLQSGQTLNPGLNVTPALVSQFLQEAHAQTDPYYQQQLTTEIEGINSSLKNAQAQYENSVANSNTQFQQGILSERNGAASTGAAFSGQRGLAEQQDLDVQNRNLASLGENAAAGIGTTLRAGGAAVGQGIAGLNGNQGSFATPTLNTSTDNLNGAYGGSASGPSLNYNYNPSDFGVGSITSAYGTDLSNTEGQALGNSLESASNAPVQSYSGLNTPTITTPKVPSLS